MNTTEESRNKIANSMFGRRTIYASFDKITKDNVIEEVNTALTYHVQNLLEEEYLYWYRRNLQPILNRVKEVRPEINNRIVQNVAGSIVDFKNGYFLTQPAFYISRNNKSQRKVDKLNEFLYRSGKQQADNEVIDWFHTVGKGVVYVKPQDDEEIPVVAHSLDPRSAFCVYSMKPGNAPVFAVNMVARDEKVSIDVFTKDKIYRLSGTGIGKLMTSDPSYIVTASSIDSIEPNFIGHVPIIEYQYNSVNMGSFESVLPLMDALNNLMSNRMDGVEQFIQSLAIAVNCEFPDKENGDPITANDIRKAGMIVLRSIGENKADFKILSEQLDQTQTQVLANYIYEQILHICAMPDTTKGGSSTSDTGTAVLARDGWFQADASARNTEDLFKRSNRLFDRIFIDILAKKGLLNINISDFELNFVRNETANVISKAQAFSTLLAAGMHPELAAGKSGISNDPTADMRMSEKYLKMIWGDPDEKTKKAEKEQTDGESGKEQEQIVEAPERGEADIIETDRVNNGGDIGGAI